MRFSDTVYPVRFDRTEVPLRALRALPKSFTRIVIPPGGFAERLGIPRTLVGGYRVESEPGGPLGLGFQQLRSDFRPQDVDIRAVRTLLRAWLRRGVSDRYLDFRDVRNVESRQVDRPQSLSDAEEAMSGNYPAGCVRFVFNEIPRYSSPGTLPLFGRAITASTSFNEFYSSLLIWSDNHLAGINEWLRDQFALVSAADGGERSLSYVVRYANDWVAYAQRTPHTYYSITRPREE